MVYIIKVTGLIDYDYVTKIVRIYLLEEPARSEYFTLVQGVKKTPGSWFDLNLGLDPAKIELWSYNTETQKQEKLLAEHKLY